VGAKAVTSETRINEWFVPRFGPPRFRAFVGLLFLPYTGMCISFTVIGAMLAPAVQWDRVGAIALIYAPALGIGAHAADTIGSKKAKPWGSYFTRKQMLMLLAASVAGAYAIGMYYIVLYAPALAIVAVLEGFFLFAYNFELWNGRFHNDFWFAVSWGALPVAAGYVIQTNSFGVLPAVAATAAAIVSYAEIRLSRPYKELKKSGDDVAAKKLESKLKILSISTIAFALVLVAARLAMP
jgi:hypothetical protein